MAAAGSPENTREDGVFELLTDLCVKTASRYCSQYRLSQKRLVSKMRSRAYEIILKKSSQGAVCPNGEPIVDLLSYYLVTKSNAKNVVDYKRSVALMKIISAIRQTDFYDSKEHFHNVLRLLIVLSDTVKEDHASQLFQNPFSFGLLEEMLPRPPVEAFGSLEPYSYYPSHVFELPYSLKRQEAMDNRQSQTYTEYTAESFESRLCLPDNSSQKQGSVEINSFTSPMSLASLTSTQVSPYSDSAAWNLPRLTVARDLHIPTSQPKETNAKVTLPNSNDDVQVFWKKTDDDSLNIWEIAPQLDKDVPNDIWEVVSKMPQTHERQLIASSPREVALWLRQYEGATADLNIISEKQFIRHIMYLIIGVETNSFPFHVKTNSFRLKSNLVLQAISKEHVAGYATDLLLVGTYYRRLYKFAFNQTLEDHFHSNGLVYEASREAIRRYLLEFRLAATRVFEECCSASGERGECCSASGEHGECLPTLLQILHHMEPFRYEIETVVSIYKLCDVEPQETLPHGAELMSYLFNEISLVTQQKTAFTMFNLLASVCRIYFKFIERFIFEGDLDDRYDEFFIRKDSQYVNTRSKRYWDKGFHIAQSVAVPEFLRPLAKFILLCGKSLRLLKHCNPSDPLVLLISSDHPSVKCCASFEELQHQQRVLDVYRTRCLFVSGEPMTFEQILLNREAERKAFTEMASIKQAETMEKIVAERKRLAQLIIAEKQHSLRVLEAAMAEAKAAKQSSRHRERRRSELQRAAEIATEEVDSSLKDDERTKIMEYYSKLNMEVEKSKIHTEWKMKRLQLDQSRMQLLSTEERILKREKLELQHQMNEDVMAMSIQSFDAKCEDELDANKDEDSEHTEDAGDKIMDSASSVTIIETEEDTTSEIELHKTTAKTSTDVFSAICNVAKSVFGVSKRNEDKKCDNKKELDCQGNVVPFDTDNNSDITGTKTSSSVIGEHLNNSFDNRQYHKTREEAWNIKEKVMSHEFGQTDKENNSLKDIPVIRFGSVDEENNVDENTPFYEARRNKLKVLGADFDTIQSQKINISQPRTDAQKEALLNRQKVLGVEYNLPIELPSQKEPANKAQEEALENKRKVLGSDDVQPLRISPRSDSAKRSGLTLNLKSYSEMAVNMNTFTPNTGGITPGEFFRGLDLETPTTADVPHDGGITSDIFTPQCELNIDLDPEKKTDKEFLNSDGFNFSLIVEEAVERETIGEMPTVDTPETSPSKTIDTFEYRDSKHSVFNLVDGSYTLQQFDPFGVKELNTFSNDHFTRQMDFGNSSSSYTHPAVIMEEIKKKPYGNIFASHFGSEIEEGKKITCDNIASLTACLQRSVMLPLTYQLEVVNNSILTYFLVNLDMYEHLRSLKDYFFLMDGEFSKSICHNLFAKLTKTLNPQDLLNFATLHNILDKALGASISHIHKFSENLSFTITESPLSFQHSSPDVLQCLSLTYTVGWPLNIILSQEALLRYAKVFQFLVKMRRIFWVLGEDFEFLKLSAKLSREHCRKLQRSPQYISVQIYRHVMASMIRALDNYIVTTCILSSWTEFETDLKKARTLDDLYECHVVYIKKVLFRCLLNNRSTPVMKLLNDIFTIILKFSRLLKAGEWQQKEPGGHFTLTSFAQLQEFFHLFEKLAKYLHKVVTKLMECGYQRHLVELLTMVNLNGYYDPEKSKEEHNSSILAT